MLHEVLCQETHLPKKELESARVKDRRTQKEKAQAAWYRKQAGARERGERGLGDLGVELATASLLPSQIGRLALLDVPIVLSGVVRAKGPAVSSGLKSSECCVSLFFFSRFWWPFCTGPCCFKLWVAVRPESTHVHGAGSWDARGEEKALFLPHGLTLPAQHGLHGVTDARRFRRLDWKSRIHDRLDVLKALPSTKKEVGEGPFVINGDLRARARSRTDHRTWALFVPYPTSTSLLQQELKFGPVSLSSAPCLLAGSCAQITGPPAHKEIPSCLRGWLGCILGGVLKVARTGTTKQKLQLGPLAQGTRRSNTETKS